MKSIRTRDDRIYRKERRKQVKLGNLKTDISKHKLKIKKIY